MAKHRPPRGPFLISGMGRFYLTLAACACIIFGSLYLYAGCAVS